MPEISRLAATAAALSPFFFPRSCHPCRRSFSAVGRRYRTTSTPSGSSRSVTGTCSGRHSAFNGSSLRHFSAVTFLFLYGWFLALRRAYRPDLPDDHVIFVGGQSLEATGRSHLAPGGLVVSLLIAVVTGASNMMEWPTFALYWYAPRATGGAVDPIFGKPISFYLFTLPAWQFITGWLLALAVIACVIAVFFIFVTGSTRMLADVEADTSQAVARVLHCVWFLVADPRDARVYRPIRAIVRRTYDFWRGDLYGCSRHASRHARRVCRVRSRCCDCKHQCRVGAARALVGGSSRSRRRLLSRTSNIRLVRQQLYREA